MQEILSKAKERLAKALEGCVILITGALVLDVIWQVATRHLLLRPSSWTDELATLLMIWLALLGASVGFVRHAHLGVDVVVARLSPRARLVTECAVYLLIGFFAAAILIWGGIELVVLTLLTNQVSPALGLKMGHVYLALPISGLLILVFSLEELAGRVARLRRKG